FNYDYIHKKYFFIGTGPVVPFLSSYARQLGFSSVIVGLIYTILPICGMVAKPLFGAIADRFHCQKKIFLASQLLTAIAFIAIFYSPQVPVERLVHFSCAYGEAAFNTYPGNAVDECTVAHIQQKEVIDRCNMNCDMDKNSWDVICHDWKVNQYCDSINQTDRFSFMAEVPLSLTQLFSGTVVFRIRNISLIDGTTVYPRCSNRSISTLCNAECNDFNVNDIIAKPAIDDRDKPNRYGHQRLFGALGWGILSALTGVMIDALSTGQSQKNYISAFYMAAAFLVLDFIVSSRLEGMVGAVFEGVGVSLGSFLAGLSYNTYKGLTFRYFGIGALIACVLHIGVQYLLKQKGNKSTSNENIIKQ
ncbi:hypothetical protein NQ314_016239, partial [Rhamnusium bicolor]